VDQAAKAAVFTAVAFLTGLAASLAAFFLGEAIFAGKGIQAHPGGSGTLRPVLGAALYLAVFGLLALGLGALPAAWQNDVNLYLPSVAGQAIIGHTKFTPPGHLLPPVDRLRGVLRLHRRSAYRGRHHYQSARRLTAQACRLPSLRISRRSKLSAA
jgi:hypothetical protein